MDKTEYSFRDVDRAVLKIFQFLQEKSQSEEGLSDEGKEVYHILEGFLSTDGSESPVPEIRGPSHTLLSPFEYIIQKGALDPEGLFQPKIADQNQEADQSIL